jgi:DNA polymerase-3 subunit beta
MQVSVLQENLAKGLSIVTKAVENRPTLPVLGNVLLETEDARLKLAATNLEMSIVCWIGAKVNQPGAITLPAKTLADLVSNLSPERVDLTLNAATHTVNVKCGATNSNIKGIDSSEFPLIPQGGEGDFTVPGKVFKEMVSQTTFAAAKEDNRPILTGIYTQIDGNVLTMAAADGYRLAVRTAEIEKTFDKPVELVIPARSLSEVARIISDEDDEVSISLPGERDIVLFHLKNVNVSSQLLEGKFPDFGAIIPRSYATSTVMYTADLLRLPACRDFRPRLRQQRPPVRQAAQRSRRTGRSGGGGQERRTRRQRRHAGCVRRGRVAGNCLQHQIPNRRAARHQRRARDPGEQRRGEPRRGAS